MIRTLIENKTSKSTEENKFIPGNNTFEMRIFMTAECCKRHFKDMNETVL